MKGIDVSSHQGSIDWSKAKSQIDFAIIRCGYGDNVESQDDSQFLNNVNGCISNNIPFGVYLYSYAKNLAGNESITSEVEHCKRLLNKISKKPFCVYIDMEDDSTTYLGKLMLSNYALEFCKQITNVGYKAGVYANENWFKNYLDVKTISKQGYSVWCAKYSSSKPNITSSYDIWQYSDSCKINGITGNVDMNEMYNDIRNTNSKSSSNTNNSVDVIYQVYSNKKKKYYFEVKNDSDFAGGSANDDNIGGIRAKLSDGTEVKIQSHIINGNFLPAISSKNYKSNDIKDSNSYSGVYGKNIDGITIFSSIPLKYRVYAGGKWYGWCYTKNANTSNWNTGVAGVKGKAITRIQIVKA
jgi:GH25 family lysozyme M1 (1,4-beta-N-acetylmuramidase)